MTTSRLRRSSSRLTPRDPKGGRPTLSVAARLGEHILDTALELFASKPVDAVGMDDLAAAASVSKRTLYARFGSKTDLMVATVEYGVAKHLRPIPRPVEGDSARERLVNAGAAMLEISLKPESRAIENLASSIADDKPALRDQLNERSYTRAVEIIGEILDDGVARGEIALANRDFAAAFVFDALVIVPRHRMQTGLRLGRTRGERQAYLREVIALIFEGLAPRSGHRPLP